MTISHRFLLLSLGCVLTTVAVTAQPRYDKQEICPWMLDRGVVAFRHGNNVCISWRTLKSDATGEPFTIYRNGKKMLKKPLNDGGNFFIDEL